MANGTVADGMVVSLAYVLRVDGEELDRTEEGEVMDYLHGAENIVPGLEKALTGKKVGERINVTLSPDEGYGQYDPEEVEEIPRDEMPEADELEQGMVIEVEDEDGDVYLAFVRELRADAVVLDYNPPLAGKTLTYDVVVKGVRQADSEELDHGHPHSLLDEFDEEE